MSVYLDGTSVLLNGGNVATSDACCCGGACCLHSVQVTMSVTGSTTEISSCFGGCFGNTINCSFVQTQSGFTPPGCAPPTAFEDSPPDCDQNCSSGCANDGCVTCTHDFGDPTVQCLGRPQSLGGGHCFPEVFVTYDTTNGVMIDAFMEYNLLSCDIPPVHCSTYHNEIFENHPAGSGAVGSICDLIGSYTFNTTFSGSYTTGGCTCATYSYNMDVTVVIS